MPGSSGGSRASCGACRHPGGKEGPGGGRGGQGGTRPVLQPQQASPQAAAEATPFSPQGRVLLQMGPPAGPVAWLSLRTLVSREGAPWIPGPLGELLGSTGIQPGTRSPALVRISSPAPPRMMATTRQEAGVPDQSRKCGLRQGCFRHWPSILGRSTLGGTSVSLPWAPGGQRWPQGRLLVLRDIT